MTELQDNTAEMQSEHIASSQIKKAKGSALDRGFPTGTVLVLLVIIVIILQGISAWKVINLESERAAIDKKGALLEKDINFSTWKQMVGSFCGNCGEPLASDEKFCPKCGAKRE